MQNNPVIVALDVESATEARNLVALLGDLSSFYKIGLELYTSAGMDFVRELKAEGHRVFLDLKLYDIGETVKRAVAQVAQTGVDFLTVHGSPTVMSAAVAGKDASGLRLLAVTVLTNLEDNDLRQMGYALNVSQLVALGVQNGRTAGVDGFICSALEVAKVRGLAGPNSILVTPGVRSAGAASGDQKRITTPAEAIASGADYLVIGRQVTRAQDPRAEMQNVLRELA